MTPDQMRKMRESAGMSQAELAYRLDRSRVWINKLENGKLAISIVAAKAIESVLKEVNHELMGKKP